MGTPNRVPLALTAVLRDRLAAACFLLLLTLLAFGRRSQRTVWQSDTREQTAKRLRESEQEE